MNAKAKKGAAKKPPKKAAKKPSAKTDAAPKDSRARAVLGAERARLNRLVAAGYNVDRCGLLGIPLDVGPRANPWHVPKLLGDDVVSQIAIAIAQSKVPPEALELAAARLAERGKP